jgi:predicted transposase/invertase (TIGR01784 family)
MLEAIPELAQAVSEIRHFSKDKEAWIQYEAEEKARKDYQTHMGITLAKGRAEGEVIGITKGKLETARAMLADGIALEKIAVYTGLSVEELEKLKNR